MLLTGEEEEAESHLQFLVSLIRVWQKVPFPLSHFLSFETEMSLNVEIPDSDSSSDKLSHWDQLVFLSCWCPALGLQFPTIIPDF